MDDNNDLSTTDEITTIVTVHLIGTAAPLLNGPTPLDCPNATADSCTGGMAVVAARADQNANSSIIIPSLDRSSPFVQMHPLRWAVNRRILSELLQFPVFLAAPSLLSLASSSSTATTTSSSSSPSPLSSMSRERSAWLRTPDWPLLLTNAAPDFSSAWRSPDWKPVHFDRETGLAILSIVDDGEAFNIDQMDAAFGGLRYIQRRNRHCVGGRRRIPLALSLYETYVPPAPIEDDDEPCWVPVIIYSDDQRENWERFIDAMLALGNNNNDNDDDTRLLPPALILDTQAHWADTHSQPLRMNNSSSTYVVSYRWRASDYDQLDLQLQYIDDSDDNNNNNNASLPLHPQLVQVTRTTTPLLNLTQSPAIRNNPLYQSHVTQLAAWGREAAAENPVVGQTTAMPVTREGLFRPCNAGECPMGNLFTDAALWWWTSSTTTRRLLLEIDTDAPAIAAITSGGIRGPGWPAGNVTVLDLWQALPFANTMCVARLSGVSLVRLLRYSLGRASFVDQVTDTGSDLLQVSSNVRVIYNNNSTVLSGPDRLVGLEIRSEPGGPFRPVDPLTFYDLITDNFVCTVRVEFPFLVGDSLRIRGEHPGVVTDISHHQVVENFLRATSLLDSRADDTTSLPAYDTSLTGRWVENPSTTVSLNFGSPETACTKTTTSAATVASYWNEVEQTCVPCPLTSTNSNASSLVTFGRDARQFLTSTSELKTDDEVNIRSSATLTNRSPQSVSIALIHNSSSSSNPSIPSWVKLDGYRLNNNLAVLLSTSADNPVLQSGENLTVDYTVQTTGLESGTTVGEIRLQLQAAELLTVTSVLRTGTSSCPDQGVVLELSVRVYPPQQLNQFGDVRHLGFSMAAIVMLLTVGIGTWVYRKRDLRIVRTMQPIFLISICVGIFLMGAVLVPLSIDDSLVSKAGVDRACMSSLWLASLGLTITFSALFSKLWRINQLFQAGIMRRRVTEKDVLGPFVILFTCNAVLLTLFQVIEPLEWSRRAVHDDEPWNTYGICYTQGVTGNVFMTLIGALNIGTFGLACWHAYRARHISDEFSESKSLGMAVSSWAQLCMIGLPALLLIDEDSSMARYCLQVSTVFVACLSMLGFIFIPLRRQQRIPRGRCSVRVSGFVIPHDVLRHEATRQTRYSTAGNNSTNVSGLDRSLNRRSNHAPSIAGDSSSHGREAVEQSSSHEKETVGESLSYGKEAVAESSSAPVEDVTGEPSLHAKETDEEERPVELTAD